MMTSEDQDVFRRQALDELNERPLKRDLLRITPAYTPWLFWGFVAILAAVGSIVTFANVGQYAEGPAVVRLEGDLEVAAKEGGSVVSVDVVPRQRVRAGQVLVRFYDAPEAAELARIQKEFESRETGWRAQPEGPVAREGRADMRARLRAAESRREQRVLRAPAAATICSVRVRPSQYVTQGETVVVVSTQHPVASVVALLPDRYGPLLRAGLPAELELSGYGRAHQELSLDSVDDEVIRISDSIPLQGPGVLAHARVPSETFEYGGRTVTYRDGMQGIVRVRLGSETVLRMLLQSLGVTRSEHG